jgi:hypothetical protein
MAVSAMHLSYCHWVVCECSDDEFTLSHFGLRHVTVYERYLTLGMLSLLIRRLTNGYLMKAIEKEMLCACFCIPLITPECINLELGGEHEI